jgi:hypothetical protein
LRTSHPALKGFQSGESCTGWPVLRERAGRAGDADVGLRPVVDEENFVGAVGFEAPVVAERPAAAVRQLHMRPEAVSMVTIRLSMSPAAPRLVEVVDRLVAQHAARALDIRDRRRRGVAGVHDDLFKAARCARGDALAHGAEIGGDDDAVEVAIGKRLGGGRAAGAQPGSERVAVGERVDEVGDLHAFDGSGVARVDAAGAARAEARHDQASFSTSATETQAC